MKRFAQLIVIFVLPAFLAACPDGKSGKKNSDDTATTPLNTACLTGQSQCYPQLYAQFPGFYPYPNSFSQYGGYYNHWQYSYGGYYSQFPASFCECGPSAIPVYNNQLGLGCVQKQYVAPIFGMAGVWSLPAVNNHGLNWTQYSNIEPHFQSSCSNGVTQACFLHKGNQDCASGQVCRPVAPGSALGICAKK